MDKQPPPQRVDVVDIDIPLGSLVLFLVKLNLAVIPVALVFGAFWWIVLKAWTGLQS
jgi:hypothetical protein